MSKLPLTFLFAIVAISISLAASLSNDANPASPTSWPPIVGSDDFHARTEAALRLLSMRDPGGFQFVLHHATRLAENERSGSHVESGLIDLARPTYAASPTWYASVLVHECEHIELYEAYLKAHPDEPVPENIYAETPAEQKCNAVQLITLRKVGAPAAEIEWLMKQTGNHWDLNGDGKYDWQDYERRHW